MSRKTCSDSNRCELRLGGKTHFAKIWALSVPRRWRKDALYHAKILEQCDFDQIVLSAKASDVRTTVLANEILAQQCSYPLHLGVTEAGDRS